MDWLRIAVECDYFDYQQPGKGLQDWPINSEWISFTWSNSPKAGLVLPMNFIEAAFDEYY